MLMCSVRWCYRCWSLHWKWWCSLQRGPCCTGMNRTSNSTSESN